MRATALILTAFGACQACSSDDSPPFGFPATDGGEAASGGAALTGAGGEVSAAGGSASGGVVGSAGGPSSGGAGGAAGSSGSGAGGAPKPCPLDATNCTSCLGSACPDAIQACGTSASCLESLSVLSSCVCPSTPNGKTADDCLIGIAARGAPEAAFAKCMQMASSCRSPCGL